MDSSKKISEMATEFRRTVMDEYIVGSSEMTNSKDMAI
jgi:hypothetical protein